MDESWKNKPSSHRPTATRPFFLLLLLVLSQPTGGLSQESEIQEIQVTTLLERADTLLLQEHLPLEALDLYREILTYQPQSYETLWRASRACLVLGILEDEWERRKEWYREGAELARQAEAQRPDDIETTYWRAANLGRWAQEEPGSREVIGLAKEVRSSADSLLRADPNHAGAHNILGMYYFEILRLNPIKRNIARILAPSVIRGIRWRDAAGHLRRAVALDPFNILYLKDYGSALLWHGDTLSAQTHLRRAIALPITLPTDSTFIREARLLLAHSEG